MPVTVAMPLDIDLACHFIWDLSYNQQSRLRIRETNGHFMLCQRFYNCLELKVQNQDAVVPPLDKTIRRITEPDVELFARNKSIIDAFRRRFEVKPNPKVILIPNFYTINFLFFLTKKGLSFAFYMVFTFECNQLAAEEILQAIGARETIWFR